MKKIDAKLLKVAMENPGDTSGIEEKIMSGDVAPENIVAIIGKTEGNGLVNDFSRGQASLACALLLSRHLDLPIEEVVGWVRG